MERGSLDLAGILLLSALSEQWEQSVSPTAARSDQDMAKLGSTQAVPGRYASTSIMHCCVKSSALPTALRNGHFREGSGLLC